MSDSSNHPVAQYYDANTRRFLATGDTGEAVAIHRKLWAPGIETPEQAAAHINDLVAHAAVSALGHEPASVTDLGCGVGGSLFHLAMCWPHSTLTGYTLSTAQVQIARTLAKQRHLQDRCEVRQGDFTALESPKRSELVMAIESHTHLPSLAVFFKAASDHVLPGGIVILVDDMLAADGSGLSRKERALLDAFKRGWRMGQVPTVEDVLNQAGQFGFDVVGHRDLGEFLRLNQPWDRMLNWIAPPLDWLGLARVPMFANMVGGNALTECHRRGVMRYMMVVMRFAG
ncbi:SAM-dependent methyltransferase [Orrella daihaiensis]|uniref:Methyltransferase domain-containing protein n=1 Tax=Orrella daihaiensis TaxID=2782176 RepID=A0ABY4AK59_9BURK|nr:methyltransferase domain-containing protein [Orrella daihaiensis]UOD50051.1 methyltransferase domain-containing protein [Orrella daihaiensis]